MGFVHDDQVPSRQSRGMGALECAHTEGGVGGEHGDLVERADPGDQLVHVRGVREGRLRPPEDETPITGPVRPPSRQAASVCASRSSEGTSTSTRPACSSSALRTATSVLPEPVAMTT